MKNISFFSNSNLFEAGTQFFEELNIPLNTIEEQAFAKEDILENTYNPKSEAHQLIDKVYFLGMTDDQSFSSEEVSESLERLQKLNSDYEGLLVIAVELKLRENGLEPTRSQLAEISRAFNREFMYTPVTVLYRYGNYIALANSERSAYKAKYKEGEKVGKVSLLRDIKYNNPHTGHLQILHGLTVPAKISTFKDLYKHWGEVFSVNVLNKKFYLELSNWYFWAVKNVTFPGEPTLDDALLQGKEYKDLQQEHKATNVIRMLTRLLFVWFMKEKKLIPDELFDLEVIKKDILNEISPYQEVGMFTEHNKDSVYYKAILQNLFFATLNCPIKSDGLDKRERGFRGEGYGTNRGIDYLLRYKKYFKKPDAFLQKLNDVVPFLNGGLFECLDDKFKNKYIDGFSDQMTKGEQLTVPDYLFFGLEEEADLSEVIGIADKKNKNAAVKGLINILKSYKFTITENTPIEEEVALDPELLGKVFENLLASYNPETKTTARKQTGSFYTPREIVNYMVDESLIAYLKNKIQSAETVHSELGASQTNLFGNKHKVGQTSLVEQHSGSELKDNEERLDELLHNLVSYNPENPFAEFPQTSKIILEQLDTCTILDPACGSGAFPMGVLQKMVHILEKLDPDNRIWKEVQIEKAKKESDEAFDIADKKAREIRLLEINEAFDEDINNPDYARKLFLIENCIYGVDIQPIATQISKLRFFISLVVEQNVDKSKDNFGIRPLPNLETKFVAANTLIGIEKENTLFSTNEIKVLEQELKKVRNKLFGARTKDTKLKYRTQDKELRLQIADKLKSNGFPVASAEKLASWDPFDQNASSSFFDPEWMFDIKEGFDIVIGNPPYIGEKGNKGTFDLVKKSKLGKEFYLGRMDYFYFFYHLAFNITKKSTGIISFITTNYFVTATGAKTLRKNIKNSISFLKIVNFNNLKVFESAAGQHNIITILQNCENIKRDAEVTFVDSKGIAESSKLVEIFSNQDENSFRYNISKVNLFEGDENFIRITGINSDSKIHKILDIIKEKGSSVGENFNVNNGLRSGIDKIGNEGVFVLNEKEFKEISNKDNRKILKKYFKNSNIKRFYVEEKTDKYIIYSKKDTKIDSYPFVQQHLEKFKEVIKTKRWNETVPWFSLVRSRDEKIFKFDKIVFPQRSKINTFAFNNTEWYAGSDVFYITNKVGIKTNLKYVLGILNSRLIYLWLYHKGKRKGDYLELIGNPIKEIPILLNPSDIYEFTISFLTSILIIIKEQNSTIENILNAVIYNLYFPEHMAERNIDIIFLVKKDIDTVVNHRKLNDFSFDEVENLVKKLANIWQDTESEILKRISHFKEKSPDILKVILES